MNVKHTELPVRIRVAQDADGFWTCREAVSGSPEFIRADAVKDMVDALEEIVAKFDACDSGIVRGTPLGINAARSALARFKDLSAEKDQ